MEAKGKPAFIDDGNHRRLITNEMGRYKKSRKTSFRLFG